jgi:catechol 2,3-dioxygenase-like lactoylglutathione lyase family enzyme
VLSGCAKPRPQTHREKAEKGAFKPPKIKQIGEIALTVTDVERSRRFYSDVLGLETYQSNKITPDMGVTFNIDTGHIGLWLPGKWKEVNPHLPEPVGRDLGGKKHFNMYIDAAETEAALANLKKHNVKSWGPRKFENGETHIDFEDPDGHLLEYVGKLQRGVAREVSAAGPPRIKQIGEVVLVIQDVERSRKFYSEVLGLEEYHFPGVTPDRGVIFRIEAGYIGLWLPGKWKEVNPHLPTEVGADLSGKTHFNMYIERSDEQAALDTLKRNNVKFWGPRYNPPDGQLHIDFEDPDGHLLEFWARPL